MEANVTELWGVIETLRAELNSLRTNVTSSILSVSAATDGLSTIARDMDTLWLMLGAILVICKYRIASEFFLLHTVIDCLTAAMMMIEISPVVSFRIC